MPGVQAAPVAVKPLSAWMMAPVLGLALITILTGLFMEPVYGFAVVVGEQLMNPIPYIQAVKGGG
jgi:multicomponent Na+:H+ antiporter subunit D